MCFRDEARFSSAVVVLLLARVIPIIALNLSNVLLFLTFIKFVFIIFVMFISIKRNVFVRARVAGRRDAERGALSHYKSRARSIDRDPACNFDTRYSLAHLPFFKSS